jgi:hypothetical protein
MADDRSDDSSPSPPSETVCAAVTVALVVYFLGLALSMTTNTSSGGSPLATTIKSRLFSPWMVPAWLDLGFDYRLTHGLDDDAHHVIEVRRYGAPRSESIRLPGDRSGEQASRWRRLARALATATDDSDRAALLPTAIGLGMMTAAESDDLLVRVMRQPPPDRVGPPAPPQQAFAARVRLVAGQPQLIRQEPRGELAPVVPQRAPGDPP